MIETSSALNLLSNEPDDAAQNISRERHVSSSSLKSVIEHDVRLDIVCCLDGEPLTVLQVSARIGKPTTAVAYHVKLLEARDLVEKSSDDKGEDTLYTASLNKHPVWVAEAVRDHRRIG